MDGRKITAGKSLQRTLSRWIIITALGFVLLGGATGGGIAFFQVRELQDNALLEIARLLQNGSLAGVDRAHSGDKEELDDHDEFDQEEESIIIRQLDARGYPPDFPTSAWDGLQTISLDGEEWRALIITHAAGGKRFAIAQQTELRDNIAWSSALAVFLPIAGFVVVMLIIIHVIIRKQFRVMVQLAEIADHQDGAHLKQLPDKDIPVEIAPFLRSINALLARIQETVQKQRRFIADAAHELRTPLAALSLQAENLARAASKIDRDERQRQLQLGLNRLRTLVAQLLDLARYQEGQDRPKTTVILNEVVRRVIAELYPLAEAANIDLGVVRQDREISVADQDGSLEQLLRNAIDNAIHYTPQGGKIDISLFVQNERATLLVEDNGSGIPDAELEWVMAPFHRLPGGRHQGNGLGLAISAQIAERLGGEIHLSNREQGGLTFRYEQPEAMNQGDESAAR